MLDNNRLNSYLSEQKMSTKVLAENLELSTAAISLIRNGKNNMSAVTLSRLLDTFPDLCANWLIRGTGGSSCKANCSMGSKTSEPGATETIMLLKQLLESKDQIINLMERENNSLRQLILNEKAIHNQITEEKTSQG